MYIVNTSFFVEPNAQSQWLCIINDKYIPFLRENGFNIVAFSRIISIEPVDTFTYSLMVEAPDIESYNLLTGEVFDEYTTVVAPMFGDRVVWLTTLMKKLN